MRGGFAHFAPSTATVEPSTTLPPSPTATQPTPTPSWEPLTPQSDGEAVRLRMLNSHLGWTSLYADIRAIDYPPEMSNLPVRIRRYQVWIQQPGRVLVLSGRLDEPPNSVFVSDGQRYRLVYPEAGRDEQGDLPRSAQTSFFPPHTLSDTIYPHPLGSLIGFPVGEIVFPSTFAQRQGGYRVVGTSTVADRAAVVLDWTAPTGLIADRFRIDALTGIVLRQQNLGKAGGGEIVQSDIVVLRIVYDPVIPQASFRLDQAYAPHYLGPPET